MLNFEGESKLMVLNIRLHRGQQPSFLLKNPPAYNIVHVNSLQREEERGKKVKNIWIEQTTEIK